MNESINNPWSAAGTPSESQMKPDKQEKEAKEKVKKESWNLADALMQAAGSALASSSSFRELGENATQAMGSILNQLGSNLAGGGPFGGLVGGLFQFGWNMLTGDGEPKLPIRDNALDTRIINFSDLVMDLASVRDRSELSFQRSRRERWRLAGARAI
jgi:hypothetical protein